MLPVGCDKCGRGTFAILFGSPHKLLDLFNGDSARLFARVPTTIPISCEPEGLFKRQGRTPIQGLRGFRAVQPQHLRLMPMRLAVYLPMRILAPIFG
jgi:hypothetical protein